MQIIVPYSAIAVYCLLIAIVFSIAFVVKRVDLAHQSRAEDVIKSNAKSSNRVAKFFVIAITALLYLFTNGMAMVLETFVTSYVVKSEHGASKAVGATMVTVNWTIHTCLGVPAIFLIKFIGLKWTLTFQVALIVASGFVFMFMGGVSLNWLWLAVVLESVGNCAVFGGLMGYLEQFFPLTGRMTSIFLLSICVGDTIWPMLVGNYIESHPEVFGFTMMLCAIATLILFVALIAVVKLTMVKMDTEVEVKVKRVGSKRAVVKTMSLDAI